MRLATTMCAKGGDLVGDDEDEGGEEGQRRYSGNDSPSHLWDPFILISLSGSALASVSVGS